MDSLPLKPRADRLLILVAVLVAAAGLVARVVPFGGFAHVGFDEHIYESYVNRLAEGVPYPDLVESYIQTQTQTPTAFLPPTRVTFLGSAALLKHCTGLSSFDALRIISQAFGLLGVGVATIFAWRAAGMRIACGVLALLSVAPLGIHLSHRALIDGFFAFWTWLSLWLLWECLRAPRNSRWLIGYALSLMLLVLTKENAAFVFIAIVAILALNRWLAFGEVTSTLLIATLAGPAAAVLLLIALAGGAETFFHTFLLNMQKSYVLDYAIKTGDGPWYRYLIDLVALSPVVTLLACGGFLALRRENTWPMFLAVFLVVTYAVMANLRYGMNLRYGAIWDLPLRLFAVVQLTALAERFRPKLQPFVLPAMLLLVAAFDLRQYFVLFARGAIYDPVPQALLHAVGILK